MGNAFRRIFFVLSVLILVGAQAFSQQTAHTLTPYLQDELNEIALLNAQSCFLQQQGDPLGAAVIASYIPDHEMQATMLSDAIRAAGGNPDTLKAVTPAPVSGNRLCIVQFDIQQHNQAMAKYQDLMRENNDAKIRMLATNGYSGATRHFSSLRIAQASTVGTQCSIQDGLLAALSLELASVCDLQTQATRLKELGDTTMATTLLNMVPAHQQQAQSLAGQIQLNGGNPAMASVPPAVPLPTREAIVTHEQVFAKQMINTYALPIAAFPGSSVESIARQGQNIQFQAMAALGCPVNVAAAR